jgi:hypothetical protein
MYWSFLAARLIEEGKTEYIHIHITLVPNDVYKTFVSSIPEEDEIILCIMMIDRQSYKEFLYLDTRKSLLLMSHKQLVLIRISLRVSVLSICDNWLVLYMYLTTPSLVIFSDLYLEKKYVWINSHD